MFTDNWSLGQVLDDVRSGVVDPFGFRVGDINDGVVFTVVVTIIVMSVLLGVSYHRILVRAARVTMVRGNLNLNNIYEAKDLTFFKMVLTWKYSLPPHLSTLSPDEDNEEGMLSKRAPLSSALLVVSILRP